MAGEIWGCICLWIPRSHHHLLLSRVSISAPWRPAGTLPLTQPDPGTLPVPLGRREESWGLAERRRGDRTAGEVRPPGRQAAISGIFDARGQPGSTGGGGLALRIIRKIPSKHSSPPGESALSLGAGARPAQRRWQRGGITTSPHIPERETHTRSHTRASHHAAPAFTAPARSAPGGQAGPHPGCVVMGCGAGGEGWPGAVEGAPAGGRTPLPPGWESRCLPVFPALTSLEPQRPRFWCKAPRRLHVSGGRMRARFPWRRSRVGPPSRSAPETVASTAAAAASASASASELGAGGCAGGGAGGGASAPLSGELPRASGPCGRWVPPGI